mmetsp:Transcript_21333/g.69047  ORF Transcript_21333/g.69047 Transcript_21333/m.69047 type:complete len:384 (+) Transcript_21333:910-2061(+)
MVLVRADIVMKAALFLKKATTIAVRYCAVRRQSNPMPHTSLEMQVLDYSHVQRTLLQLVATSYAFHFTSLAMGRSYSAFAESARRTGDFSALPELHATSSGLKAYCTWVTKDGIETCRVACGGHGFLSVANFAHTLTNYMPMVTYEGENHVLMLQTARFLLKEGRAAANGATSFPGMVSYLSADRHRARLDEGASLRDPETLVSILAYRAARRVRELTTGAGALGVDDALLADQNAAIAAARAHCELFVASTFAAGLAEAAAREEAGLTPSARSALERLCALHALVAIENAAAELLEDGFVSGAQVKAVRAEAGRLVAELRPDAVPLVDAFGLSDYHLDSALGARDGDVYRRLFDAVQTAPFNASHAPPGYEEILAPVLRSKL